MKKILGMIIVLILGLVTYAYSAESQDDSHKTTRMKKHARGVVETERHRDRPVEYIHHHSPLRTYRSRVGSSLMKRGFEHRIKFLKKIGVTEEQLGEIETVRLQLREDMKTLKGQYSESFQSILTDEQREAIARRTGRWAHKE